MIKRLLNIIIFVFIFALYFITFLFIYDTFRERKLSEMSKDALNLLEKENKKQEVNTNTVEEISATGISYGNFTVLGKLEIPKVGVSAVILKEQTYAAMNVGVVKTYGTELNTPGGFIIAGHNFRGRSQFMYPIKNLKAGDKIYITDTLGIQMGYTVYSVERYVSPNETSYFKSYGDKYHVVLSTCENGGKSRIIVKAEVSD